MVNLKELDSVEIFALQVLLAQKIEGTPESALIFNGYNERAIFEGIMVKLCPPKIKLSQN